MPRSSILGTRALDWDVHGFEVCSHVGLSLFDRHRFFLVEFLVELGRQQCLDEGFVFARDFACTDEQTLLLLDSDRLLPVQPQTLLLLDSDRLLPVQPLRDGFLKLSDSETEQLVRQLQCGQARIGQGDHDFTECPMSN